MGLIAPCHFLGLDRFQVIHQIEPLTELSHFLDHQPLLTISSLSPPPSLQQGANVSPGGSAFQNPTATSNLWILLAGAQSLSPGPCGGSRLRTRGTLGRWDGAIVWCLVVAGTGVRAKRVEKWGLGTVIFAVF
jgi:hypothetical protein